MNADFIKGKTVILTGGRAVLSDGKSCGSTGCGIAAAFTKEGAALVITGRKGKKLTAAKEGIRGLSRVAATGWGKDEINVKMPHGPLRRPPRLRSAGCASSWPTPTSSI